MSRTRSRARRSPARRRPSARPDGLGSAPTSAQPSTARVTSSTPTKPRQREEPAAKTGADRMLRTAKILRTCQRRGTGWGGLWAAGATSMPATGPARHQPPPSAHPCHQGPKRQTHTCSSGMASLIVTTVDGGRVARYSPSVVDSNNFCAVASMAAASAIADTGACLRAMNWQVQAGVAATPASRSPTGGPERVRGEQRTACRHCADPLHPWARTDARHAWPAETPGHGDLERPLLSPAPVPSVPNPAGP